MTDPVNTSDEPARKWKWEAMPMDDNALMWAKKIKAQKNSGPLTPESAEIKALRETVYKLAQDLAGALHSRSIWRARFKRSEVEIASLKAENEQIRSDNDKHLENARTLTASLAKLSAENEALKVSDFLGELFAERTKASPDFPKLVEKSIKSRSKKARKR